MADPTLDDLLHELERTPVSGLPALLTKTWQACERAQQARIVAAATQIADALRSLNIDIDETPKKTTSPASGGAAPSDRDYGDVIKTVWLVIDDRLEPGEPFSASDIAKKLRTEFPDEDIEMVQIHNAIRGLKRQGRIVRVSRGEYIRANSYSPRTDQPAEQAESEPETSNQEGLPMQQDFMS